VHTVYDHTSVLATLRSRYGITDLSKRMAAAADLGDCIDPAKIGKPSPPPTGLPKVPVRLSTALRLSGESSQPELEQLANSESLRAHVLDDRPLDARIREFLQQAEELGAVELLD
jgi:phospholipase C